MIFFVNDKYACSYKIKQEGLMMVVCNIITYAILYLNKVNPGASNDKFIKSTRLFYPHILSVNVI